MEYFGVCLISATIRDHSCLRNQARGFFQWHVARQFSRLFRGLHLATRLQLRYSMTSNTMNGLRACTSTARHTPLPTTLRRAKRMPALRPSAWWARMGWPAVRCRKGRGRTMPPLFCAAMLLTGHSLTLGNENATQLQSQEARGRFPQAENGGPRHIKSSHSNFLEKIFRR